MELTAQNYYTLEADREYFSVSQLDDWLWCQQLAYRKYVKGDFGKVESTSYTEGNFGHTYFESPMAHAEFCKAHQLEIYKGKDLKEMRANFKTISEACRKAEQDPNFMKYMSNGEKEKIYTAEWLGVKWKIRVDIINESEGWMSDLKCMASLTNSWGSDKNMPFYETYGYWKRFAIYSKLLEIIFGRKFKLYMPVITKEENSIRKVFVFGNQDRLEMEQKKFEPYMQEILRVKKDGYGFTECGECMVCRSEWKCPEIIEATSIATI